MGICLGKEAKAPAKPVEDNRRSGDGVKPAPLVPQNILEEIGNRNQPISSTAQGEKKIEGGDENNQALPLENKENEGKLISSNLEIFPYSVLKAATHKFSHENLIGIGSCGKVYRGWIDRNNMAAANPGKGLQIAVKKCRNKGVQGQSEWVTECTLLCQFDHPNVVKLMGYCSKEEKLILIYEYMARGSLEHNLLREGNTTLNWIQRVKVAMGAAKGLAYLHNASKPVIHRDLKAANILLDLDLNAKISDFGLAKLGPEGGKSHVTTRVLGTKGYFAPEYIRTGQLTFMTDVYSFGVVLVEIMAGCQTHTDGMPADLAQWARPYLASQTELHWIIDPKLQRRYRMRDVYSYAEITRRCLDLSPKSRPTMKAVATSLEKLYLNMKTSMETS